VHILVVEDDVPVRKFLSDELRQEKYEVSLAATGREAQRVGEESHCDLVILDLTLPDMSGFEVLRDLRATRPHLPVLILTGKESIADRVCGLDWGADDYMTKPFSFSELAARVRALLRRSDRPLDITLRVGDLELDRIGRSVHRAGRPVELTPKEFALLEYLMLHAGTLVSRSTIMRFVWKLSSDTLTNVVDVYINYLRRKIDSGAADKLIHTVRGSGYRIGDATGARRAASS
jgi:two-component system copper resistance phosphate regulon response regulator CusR